MAARNTKLKERAVGELIEWVSRINGADEVFEAAAIEREPSLKGLRREGIPLHWVGRAAGGLGLAGEASPEAAARVLQHGLGPRGEALQTGIDADGGQDRVRAYGIVWSTPKTVSVLIASDDAQVRQAAQDAVRAASDAYLETLENALTVRRGAGGVRTERVSGLVAVRAFHATTSAGDPHLHCHWIVSAGAPSATDGAWRALDGRMIFQSQKIAEARANRALREALQTRLGVTEWTRVEVGSVPAFEIAALRPVVAAFSKARDHMRDIARALGISFDLRSRVMDARLWREHRERKKAIAEAMEHQMDTALHAGGTAAEAIRGAWAATVATAGCGNALRSIRARPSPHPVTRPVEDFATLEADRAALVAEWRALRPTDTTIADAKEFLARYSNRKKALRRALAEAAADLASMGTATRVQAAIGIRSARARLAAAQQKLLDLEKKITELDEIFARAELVREKTIAAAAIRDRIATIDAVSARAMTLMRALTNVLGTFTPHDVVARLVAEGAEVTDGYRQAARLLRYWKREGAVHARAGLDLETICKTLDAGGFSTVTADVHAMTRTHALVPDALIKAEIVVADAARALSMERRSPILMAIPQSFTPEQARAAAAVAAGRALTVTVGVAGSGKSFLAAPVVKAAQFQGFTVRVLTRNAVLAAELGNALGCDSAVFAGFDPARPPAAGKTLIIVDEAGVGDQADLTALLDAAKQHPTIQIWMIGDRAQAQPIDRRATFSVIEEAVHPGALTRLTKSYRCNAWAEEHDLLRASRTAGESAAQVLAQKMADAGRVIAADPDDTESAIEKMAEIIEFYRARGEDVLGIARDNARAAALSEYIQAHLGIATDPRTALRFDQRAGVGDVVRTRKNDRRLGVKNGDLWKILAISGAGTITVQSVKNPRRAAVLPIAYTCEALELGYAATADAAQGVTVDRAVVDTTGMGAALLYSAGTRGRQAPVAVVAARDMGGAVSALAATLAYDDVAQTMRQIIADDATAARAAYEAALRARAEEEAARHARQIAIAQRIVSTGRAFMKKYRDAVRADTPADDAQSQLLDWVQEAKLQPFSISAITARPEAFGLRPTLWLVRVLSSPDPAAELQKIMTRVQSEHNAARANAAPEPTGARPFTNAGPKPF